MLVWRTIYPNAAAHSSEYATSTHAPNTFARPISLPNLDAIEKSMKSPGTLHMNRELLDVVYSEHHVTIFEKIHGTEKILVTYRDLEYNQENNFNLVSKYYVGTLKECQEQYPHIQG